MVIIGAAASVDVCGAGAGDWQCGFCHEERNGSEREPVRSVRFGGKPVTFFRRTAPRSIVSTMEFFDSKKNSIATCESLIKIIQGHDQKIL